MKILLVSLVISQAALWGWGVVQNSEAVTRNYYYYYYNQTAKLGVVSIQF
jgi:hypothetical protein